MLERFLELFDQVFDSEGNVKPCGRATCIELMKLCMEIHPNLIPDYYGDMDPSSSKQGFMDVQHIKALRDMIVAQ
ncbi:MAG: hypothetical protein IJ867_08105 [Clostridia bacterium]|nr:hypothetical protein [Clostridia bacterium]